MNDVDPNGPEAVLLRFFEDMNRWETDSFTAIDQIPDDASNEEASAVYDPVVKELDCIFRNYCTPRERPQGRRNSLAVASPPDCDPETQSIVETIYENSHRVLINTIDRKRSDQKFRYVLLKTNDQWLIDNKKYLTFDGKFDKDIL